MTERSSGAERRATHPATPAEPAVSESTADDASYMRRCLELARHALTAGDVPVGALVVREDRVVGEGYERTRAELDPAAHGEVEALRAACRVLDTLDLSGATLYTTVEPCVLCAYAVRETRIHRVVFGVNAGALGGVSGPYALLTDDTRVQGSAPAVQGGVLAEECRRLLAERKAGG